MDGIFGSPLVQTAIAMVVVWFLAAMVCSGIIQLIGMTLGFKATNLWLALEVMLTPGSGNDKPKAAITQAAALAKPIAEPTGTNSYTEFIKAVPGVTRATLQRASSIDRETAVAALVRAASIPDGDAEHEDRVRIDGDFALTPLGKMVVELPPSLRHDAVSLRNWFGSWFDSQMGQLSKAYRRRIRWWTVLVGLVMALTLQIDSVAIARDLYSQPTTRQLLVADAERLVAEGDGAVAGCTQQAFADRVTCVQEQVRSFESLEISGWQRDEKLEGPDVAYRGLGLALTVGAIAAGAPFWYDLLRRLMGLKPKDPSAAPAAS